MKTIETYTDLESGVAGIVATGNDKFPYRVIMRDTDANLNFKVIFTKTLDRADELARQFANV